MERFGHSFLLAHLNDERLQLSLPNSERHITIATEASAFARNDSEIPIALWNAEIEGWKSVLGASIPAPGATHLSTPLIDTKKDNPHIAYDILGLIYWMFCRKEEIGRTDLDRHSRFPAIASHAYRNNYLERPIVDEWLDILGQVIRHTWPGLKLKQHSFSIKLSHDVDNPSRYGFRSARSLLLSMGGDILKRGDLRAIVMGPWIRMRSSQTLHPRDPYNTFEWIMETSEQAHLKSAFYFIPDGTDPHDGDYQLGHPAIRRLMREIHDRGHEVGLHPSYETYRQPDLLCAEANYLRQIMKEEGIQQRLLGGRMHYLRWEQPTTLRAWADAGMNYDSTLGYADNVGFRCGTCFEYPAFDPIAQETLALRIRPLIAMESTVTAKGYMGLGTGTEARDKFLALKNACRQVGGCFTLLWHNSELLESKKRKLYKDILFG